MVSVIRTDLDIISSALREDGTFSDPSVTTTFCRNNGITSTNFRSFVGRIDHFAGLHIHLINNATSTTDSVIVLNYPPTNRFHISIVQL